MSSNRQIESTYVDVPAKCQVTLDLFLLGFNAIFETGYYHHNPSNTQTPNIHYAESMLPGNLWSHLEGHPTLTSEVIV